MHHRWRETTRVCFIWVTFSFSMQAVACQPATQRRSCGATGWRCKRRSPQIIAVYAGRGQIAALECVRNGDNEFPRWTIERKPEAECAGVVAIKRVAHIGDVRSEQRCAPSMSVGFITNTRLEESIAAGSDRRSILGVLKYIRLGGIIDAKLQVAGGYRLGAINHGLWTLTPPPLHYFRSYVCFICFICFI